MSHATNQDSTPRTIDVPLLIDCNDCVLHDSAAFADCVATFLCRTDATSPGVVDLAGRRAIKLFDTAGLWPPLRHRPGTTDLTGT